MHRFSNLPSQVLPYLGDSTAQDRDLSRQVGVFQPVVEAAALEGVVHFPGPVRGQHDARRLRGAEGAGRGGGGGGRGEQREEEGGERGGGAGERGEQQHARRGEQGRQQ